MTEGSPELAGQTPPSSDPDDGPPTLFSQLGKIAATIGSDGVSRGERAELRRMTPDAVPPEVYWRLTERLDPVPSAAEDTFWMTVTALMAQHRHDTGRRPGRVLAEAGVSPSRVTRWLRRDRESAWREAGRLLSQLGSSGLDWARFGSLLKRWDDEKVRRRFARDYFTAYHRSSNHVSEED